MDAPDEHQTIEFGPPCRPSYLGKRQLPNEHYSSVKNAKDVHDDPVYGKSCEAYSSTLVAKDVHDEPRGTVVSGRYGESCEAYSSTLVAKDVHNEPSGTVVSSRFGKSCEAYSSTLVAKDVHDEPSGTVVSGIYGERQEAYSSTIVSDDKRHSSPLPHIVVHRSYQPQHVDKQQPARYTHFLPHYFRLPHRKEREIHVEGKADGTGPPPYTYTRKTGYGFRCVAQRTEPQCFIGPGHHNRHNDFVIYNKPDGLNSMLESEDSPSKLHITKVPTLIIGMGLSHDCFPGDYDIPSIAAVVHSKKWPQISEYRGYVQTQTPKVEMIESLYKPVRECDGKTRDAGIMRELLEDFYDSSGKRKPEQIIIFRYGDSESQLTHVLNAEVDQIIESCKCFDEKWSPKFLVIKFFKNGDLPSGTIKKERVFDDFVDYLQYQVKLIDGTMPRQYRVELDKVSLSEDVLQHLVDSLSYLHQLRIYAVNSVARNWFGIKWTPSELERLKAKIGPDEVNLQREREFIRCGEEVAFYALGHLNAETGGKYKFERHLYDEYVPPKWDDPVEQYWQHVSMYARELDGDNVPQRKIVFAEMCYSIAEGKYESIVHSVLDPNDHAGIMYGCRFCFPSCAGPHMSPHPSDVSKCPAAVVKYP